VRKISTLPQPDRQQRANPFFWEGKGKGKTTIEKKEKQRFLRGKSIF